jgi:hypothetical protein
VKRAHGETLLRYDAIEYGERVRPSSRPFECPDALVNYSEQGKDYGLIIHDGGSSVISIAFCPWCGAKLPS